MKDDTHNVEHEAPGRTPHERFLNLGKQVLTVPKAEVDAREQAWQRGRKKLRRKKR